MCLPIYQYPRFPLGVWLVITSFTMQILSASYWLLPCRSSSQALHPPDPLYIKLAWQVFHCFSALQGDSAGKVPGMARFDAGPAGSGSGWAVFRLADMGFGSELIRFMLRIWNQPFRRSYSPGVGRVSAMIGLGSQSASSSRSLRSSVVVARMPSISIRPGICTSWRSVQWVPRRQFCQCCWLALWWRSALPVRSIRLRKVQPGARFARWSV